MKTLIKTILYTGLFATAMAFLESAVVIYLRELYYPGGFSFPLKPMPRHIAVVELLRETATVLMLIAVGYLAGKSKLQRFAWFSFTFAIWDLFYYLFLYLFLGWPQTPGTWDILFLIPVPWVGPVWAPCLLSLLMFTGSLFVLWACEKDPAYRIARIHWLLLFTGAAVCILAFMWDYMLYHHELNTHRSAPALFEEIADYVPSTFNTTFFTAGAILMAAPVFYNIFISLKIKTKVTR